MKRNFKSLSLIILMLAIVTISLLLVACNTQISYKLNFIVDDSVYSTIDTNGNETITMPQEPTKEGYVFDGWYLDKDVWEKPFVSDSLVDFNLSNDISIYAKWKEQIKTTFTSFTKINNEEYSLKVANNTSYIFIEDYIVVDNESNWILSKDVDYSNVIKRKIADLTIGDNTYYVLVTKADSSTELYTLHIRRRPIYTVSFNTNGGTVVDNQLIEEDDFATEPNTSKAEYEFKGWDYDFSNSITNDVEITAQWKATAYRITYYIKGGVIAEFSAESYTIEDEDFILNEPTKEGYVFLGWYTEDNITSTKITTFDTSLTQDIELYAQWGYTINYELNSGVNDSNNPTVMWTSSKDNIGLSDPSHIGVIGYVKYNNVEYNTNSGTYSKFEGWYTEPEFNNKVTKISNLTSNITLYAKWTNASYIRVDSDNKLSATGEYIYFGEYPKTLKENKVTITSTMNSKGYYLGSDGFYYVKVTASPDDSSDTFVNGTALTSGTVYYFKVEPIKWRILTTTSNEALILCEDIIEAKRYDDDSNNYKDSEIRAWLNSTFLYTAFSSFQQELIKITEVDNSAVSTGDSSNPYVCANTQDKVFLFSYSEVTDSTYGFSSSYSSYDAVRQKKVTDYSQAKGAWINTSSDYLRNGYWWLRSPGSSYSGFSNFVHCVYGDGDVSNIYIVSRTSCGVVPALKISLS